MVAMVVSLMSWFTTTNKKLVFLKTQQKLKNQHEPNARVASRMHSSATIYSEQLTWTYKYLRTARRLYLNLNFTNRNLDYQHLKNVFHRASDFPLAATLKIVIRAML